MAGGTSALDWKRTRFPVSYILLVFGFFPSVEPRAFVVRPYHPVSVILHISRILCRRSTLQCTLRFLYHVLGRQSFSLFFSRSFARYFSPLGTFLCRLSLTHSRPISPLLFLFTLSFLFFFYLTQFFVWLLTQSLALSVSRPTASSPLQQHTG